MHPTESTTSANHHKGPPISVRVELPMQQGTAAGTSEKKPLNEADGSISKFTCVLLICVLLLFTWYIYMMTVLADKLKDEGLWAIITGDSGEDALKGHGSERPEGARKSDLERSLNALAGVLGISPVQVAAAVKPLIPQASLTKIASKAESGSSEAVRVLVANRKDEK